MRRAYPAAAYAPDAPPSYWAATAPGPALRRRPAEGAIRAGTAIIGGGFTGLNAALTLAQRGEDVALFDAAFPGWGASGRNGGFVCPGGSALGAETQVKRFGFEETKRFFSVQRAAVDHVAALLGAFSIDADRHSDGEWALAHSAKSFERMKADAEAERRLGLDVDLFSQGELDERGMRGPEFHGGARIAPSFAINPMKYAAGLASAAEEAGARLYTHSPVTMIRQEGEGFRLRAGSAELRARRLIIAVNGYGADGWAPGLDERVLPVLSSIFVTRPLSADERSGPGWASGQAAYDTRSSVHYFRLLPEGRFLFGARGGSSLNPLLMTHLHRRIRRDFERMFPHWAHIEAEYQWNGLLALTSARSLFAGPLEGWKNAWAALGYHGNGVAMGSWCGKALAELALGDRSPESLPAIMRGPLRRFPLPRFRMAYIKGYYAMWDLGEYLRG